ncbi:MAG: 30S ribosomal protein S26e [Candidatus Brockarchaeota archaeon]|nr:30S ribosomal protein S26e [Candidatus Brockarchaeota archaeon]
MVKKRKSSGRAKGSKGRSELVECSQCGQRVPRDKAKKVTRFLSFVEPTLAKELRKAGTFLPRTKITKYYCVSCAVHAKISKVRAKEERKMA